LVCDQNTSLSKRDVFFGKDVPSQTEIAMWPYVVSEDIALLLSTWGQAQDFSLPCESYFSSWREEMTDTMRHLFSHYQRVEEREMVDGLSHLIARIGLPVLSLDGVYIRADLSLEIARQVNERGEDAGLGSRPGTPSLRHQLRTIQQSGLKEVLLADDVIFSGSLIERVCRILARLDIRVPVICAGVGIGEGVNKLVRHGREVFCVRMFDQVIDEVCERDFVPGVPQSGRALRGEDRVGIPYLFPFGDPVRWASIPEDHAASFSTFCLTHAIRLFEEVEHLSDKPVRCCDLARVPIGLPQDEIRFVDALRVYL
jgi:hypothetical protein